MMDPRTRLDRQIRIEGWNQEKLDPAVIGIAADSTILPAMFIMSSAALGINNYRVISPGLDEDLLNIASNVNPNVKLLNIEGYVTNPCMTDFFSECDLIVDMTRYNLANKILINNAYMYEKPVVRCHYDKGLRIFSYLKGREWSELEEVVAKRFLPNEVEDDPVTAMIASGIVLEEVKNILMENKVSDEVIKYKPAMDGLSGLDAKIRNNRILVVGAGALGNAAGMCLGYSGFELMTIMDPDIADETNLNRQFMLYDAVGKHKALTLAKRLKQKPFRTYAKAITDYFRRDIPLGHFDVVFDCVDNFETRIDLSERCKQDNVMLISGGTNVDGGQVIPYVPGSSDQTPAEFMGLYNIVDRRKAEVYTRERASCSYRPDPSVIMTNEIIGAMMVDSMINILNGGQERKVFYDSNSDRKMG